MSDKLTNYLQDLIYLIKEDYNDALLKSSENKKETETSFYKGQEFAYYNILSLVESQLYAFDETNKLIGEIVPKVGERAKL